MNNEAKKKKVKVEIECDCGCQSIVVHELDWGGRKDFSICFYVCAFYSGQSVIRILKERIKMAWLALRKGNYVHNEIITNKEALTRLRDGLNEILNCEVERND